MKQKRASNRSAISGQPVVFTRHYNRKNRKVQSQDIFARCAALVVSFPANH
ncbi:hypothetical protein KKE26_05430 [bacterium]|nr:hypothetical protein [bacterium]MBU1754475.1 hypothetical protein [bacterium]